MPIYYSSSDEISNASIGGKAQNLFSLKHQGFLVPKWVVIPIDFMELVVMENNLSSEEIKEKIAAFEFPKNILQEIQSYFQDERFVAVRSSATEEDGKQYSFAGIFESHLHVPVAQIDIYIKKVWLSAFSERTQQYCQTHQLETPKGIAVIIQSMVAAEVSGVAFGRNPAHPNEHEQVITAVYGLGEGIVSGALDADHFYVRDHNITRSLADKKEAFDFNAEQGFGIIKSSIPDSLRHQSSLTNDQVKFISKILSQLELHFGGPQDIEFAVFEQEIYLLQSRPITNLTDTVIKENHIIWDNSNIIESYPGVTTPLTFSFIRQSYEGAYRLFAAYMGVEDATIQKQQRIFANTLGLIHGRVYYNLRSWYQMLALLPGYKINARFMEKMMGVKERFDLPDHQISRSKATWQIVKMIVQMYFRYRSLPKQREQFMHLLENTISEFKKINFEEKTPHELMSLYLRFEKTLLNQWKAPLLNDFFAMIWFGRLQKKCNEYLHSDNPNLHNDLLCGSADIISVEPIHRCIAIATLIQSNAEWRKLFTTQSESEIWKTLPLDNYSPLRISIENYINDFGERCVGELKLETISYQQNPLLFIKVIQSYVQNNITEKSTSSGIEEKIRKAAEIEIAQKVSGWKKRSLLKTMRKARELVSARENLRYERTRAFGIVRAIFSAIGFQFEKKGILQNRRDVFYLTMQEIFSFIEGTAVQEDYQSLVDLRKKEFERYHQEPAPAQRISTYGTVYQGNKWEAFQTITTESQSLKGIGCCPGIVQGKVCVVTDPQSVPNLNGDILVTHSTDPGWVTLFPSASGIIVERGSLLSHSAIVSREMGIPCIVSVTGLLQTLKTGDEIKMNGSTGHIEILNTPKE